MFLEDPEPTGYSQDWQLDWSFKYTGMPDGGHAEALGMLIGLIWLIFDINKLVLHDVW